jgi:hypothetical protein
VAVIAMGSPADAWLGDAEAALVRPDKYVFGTGTPDALITACRRSLGEAAQ